MKKLSRTRRITCSSLMIGFLLTVGFSQTPLNGSNIPYCVDFASEVSVLAEGNCNGESYTFGESGGVWVINNAEGDPANCDPSCSNAGGANDNEFETVEFNISCLSDVTVSIDYNYYGDLENINGAPDCVDNGLGCGNDGVTFYYNLDGSGSTLLEDIITCNTGAGTSNSSALNGSTLQVNVVGGTQAGAEFIEIEKITIDGVAMGATNGDCGVDDVLLDDGSNGPFDNSCDTDEEVWFIYTATGDGAVQIGLTNNGGNPNITQVLSDCSGTNPSGLPDAVTFTSSCLLAGEDLYIAIGDPGVDGTLDEFDIEITLLPPPDPADNTIELNATDINTDNTVCEGETFSLELINAMDPNDGTWIYDWEQPDGTVTNATNPLNIPAASIAEHDMTWMVTVTDGNGCSTEETFDLVVGPLPIVNDTEISACEDAPASGTADFTLEDAADGTDPNNVLGISVDDAGGNTVSYFDVQADAQDPIGNPTSTISTPFNSTDGTIIYARVEDPVTGCFDVAEVTLSVLPAPAVILTGDWPMCPGQDITFGETGGDATMWMWSGDMGASFDDDTAQNPVSNDVTDGETITVIVTDATGCTSSASEVVSLNPPPSNDECSGAIAIASNGLTNDCASEDDPLGSCGAPQQEATVWYTYTVASPLSSLQLTLTPGTIGGAAWAVYDGCGGTLLGEECGGGDIILECVPAGDIFIQVGSDPTTTGDFGIDAVETSPVANDTCDDPIDATPSDLCMAENFSGITTGACPEPLLGPASCTQTTDPTIWFEFTADPAATSVIFDNVNGDFQMYVSNCPPDMSASSCISSGPTTVPVAGGTTYLISGTDSGGAGTVSFDLTMNAAPANDLCADATMITGDVSGTTACATGDINLCSENNHVVYYSYTAVNDGGTITITANPDGSTAPVVDAWIDCVAGTQYDDTQSCGSSVMITCVPAGTEIFIPVGSATDDDGTFDLVITDVAGGGVANDLCDDAIDLETDIACTIYPASGSTVDACPETFTGGCTQMTDPTVWFTFTTLPNTTTADFTAVNGEFQLFTDCVGTAFGGCITSDGPVTVNPSTQYYVSATVNGGEGPVSFDIALLQAPTNDMCANAEDASGGSAAGDTACASTDGAFCGASGEHVVYYTYTVAQTGTVEISVAVDGATDIALEVWSDCNGTDYDPAQTDCAAMITLDCVPAGTMLTIPVGSALDGDGTFNLTINETASGGPTNDGCDMPDPWAIVDLCVPETQSGDTSGACPEASDLGSGCSFDVDATTWYEFTVDPTGTSAEFTNITGGIEYAVFDAACPVANLVSGCNTGDSNFAVTGGATYFVAVAVPGGEGAFTMDLTISTAPANDQCADAIGASSAPLTGNNLCATNDATLCGGTDLVVYYSYTVQGPGTVTLDVTVTAGSAMDLSFGIQNGCGGDIIDESCMADGTLSVDCIPEGTEIIIPIGTADGDAGDFEVSVIEIPGGTGVANDECSDAEVFTALECLPITISGSTTDACPELFTNCGLNEDPAVWFQIDLPAGATSGFFDGITNGANLGVLDGCGASALIYSCVNGDMTLNGLGSSIWVAVSIPGGEGSFEFNFTALIPPPNDLCDDATDGSGGGTTCCAGAEGIGCSDSNTVWHQFTPSDPNATVIITVTNVSISGTMGVGTFVGPDCPSMMAVDPCLGGASVERIVSCLDGDAVWVQISSGVDDCGEYDITFVEQVSDCELGAECGSDFSLFPATNSGAVCEDACNEGVCNMDCGMSTIWFEITTDDLASGMLIEVDAEFTPTIVMLNGDCNGTPTIPCGTASSSNTAVQPNTAYYIGIGIASGDPGNFTLCVTTVLDFANCSVGDLEITRPEYPGEDPNGPYCPGEKVNFCYTVDFTVDNPGPGGNNCQWIQGIVPSIGGGWDLDACPIEGQGPGGWSWFDDDEVEYQISTSIYGLSTNCAGDPILTSDISGGLGIGTPIPGGWYFTSPGPPPDCDNTGNPNTMYGLPLPGCGGNQTVEFCFELAANNPSDITECTDPCFSDMGVAMFVFADGQTGCWSQNTCAADTPTEFLDGSLDCGTLIFVEGPVEDEICSGGQLDLEYSAVDGVSDILLEICESGPNIIGASDGVTFTGGLAQITDVLENTGTEPEVIIYCLSAVSMNGSICNGPKLEVEVTVFPEILIEFDEPYNICFDGQEEIIPMISGGSGNYTTYEWSNGESTPTIMAPLTVLSEAPGIYNYTLIVTDDLGCTGEATVEYIIRPEVNHMLNGTATFACLDMENNMEEICAVIDAGQDNEPFTYDWIYDSDLIASPDEFCLIIDDENSQTGDYEIFVEVTDQYGCVYLEGPIFFSIEDGPEIQPEIPTCINTGGGDVEYSFEVCDDNGGIAEWSLFDETCSIQLDGPFSGNCVTFFVTPFAPGDDIPVTYCIQAIDLETNCVGFDEVIIDPPTIPDIPEMVEGCVGQTGTITLGNPGDFEAWTWCDGVSDGDTYTFTFEEDEICFVSVFDFNGCEITYEIEIDVSDGAAVEISGSTAFCAGSSTTLCATPSDSSYDYLWSTSETTDCITVTTAGNYSVELSAGNCVTMDDIDVTVGANLMPVIIGEDVCVGGSVVLSTGNSFSSYAWTDAAGNPIAPTDPAIPWEIEVTTGGNYTVNVSDGSCDGSGSFVVNESTPPTADIMPANPCNSTENGNITTLDIASLVMNATGNVSILNPSGAPLIPTTVDFDGLPAGPLTYTAVIEGQDPCDDALYDIPISVEDCGCPSLVLFDIGNFCTNTSTDVQLFSFLGQNVETDGTFTIEDAAGNSVVLQPDGTGQLTVDMTTASGTYTLIYTLNNTVAGCPDFTSINFTVDNPPTPVVVTPDALCNSNATGGNTMIDLDTIVSGAVGFWEDDTGAQLASSIIDFDGLATGQYMYSFQTTDAMGECPNSSPPVTITVIDCDCPIIALNPLPGPLCQTDAEINIGSFLLPGTEAGQWTATDPNGDSFTLGTGTSFDPAGLQGGIYTFTYTLSGTVPATCDDSVTGTIEVVEQLQGVVLDAIQACGSDLNPIFPSVIDFTAIPELAGYSGSWSAPANFNGGVIDDETAVDFTGIDPTDIIFTFTTDNAVAPCENLDINLVINVENCDCPIVSLSDTEVCNNDALVDLNDQLNPGSAPGEFSYDSGPESNVTLNGTEFDANGLGGGDYVFIYTIDPASQLAGCPETDTLIITVSEPSTIDLGDDLTACGIQSSQGESILNLDELTGGAQGSWNPPTNYTDPIASYESVSFLGLPVGESYTFTFLGLANGSCDAPIDDITVTVIDCDCPNVNINEGTELCNDDDTFDISSLLTALTVDGSLSVVDANGDPVTTNNNIFDASGLAEGDYTVIFTPDVAPPSDCVQDDTAILTVFAPPIAGVPAAPATFCEEDGEVIGLADLLDGESTGGSWQETSAVPSINVAFDETNGTFNTDGQAPGVYTFEYFFDTSNSPCDPVQETVVVEIEATPNADAGPGGTIDCDNNSISLGGSGSSTGAEFEYSWVNSVGDTIYQGSELELEVMSGGDYVLVVTNTLTGCSETSSTLVMTDEAFPVFTLNSEDISCFGFIDGIVTINDDVSGTPPFTFLLNGPGANNLSPDGQSWFDLGPGNYTVNMVDGLGCETSQNAIIVEPLEMSVSIGDNDFQLAIGDTVLLNTTEFLDLNMLQSVTWTQDGEVICEGNAADGNIDDCVPLQVEPPLIPTEYCLVVITDEGCELVACRSLQAQDVRDVYFPTVISDFGSDAEANTTFYVHTDEFVVGIPSFAIYDRWGELIHSYEDGFPNDPAWGWDGYFNGEQAAQGVYVYIIELEYGNEETEIFTGTVTVTR